MAQFETISHGEPNWEQKVNKNFSNVVQDTGIQNLTVLAPATGAIVVRIYNGVLFFAGSITPNATGDVPVALAPATSNTNFSISDMSGAGTLNVSVKKGTNIVIKGVTSDNQHHQFSFDGNNIFVGPWAEIGGVATPLYQRFKDFFGLLFNTKLEVA